MMAAAMHAGHLIDRLPQVRGRLTADAPLAQVTWFRVGGPAEVMFRPADIDDLSAFLAAKPADVPVTVIGVASNLLVRDGGIKGVVVRLGRGFVEIETNDNIVTAGSGALDFNVDADCSQYSARLKSTGIGAASSNTSTCEMRDTRYVRTCPSTAPTRYHTLPFATNPSGLIKRSTGSQFSPRSYLITSLRSIQSASCKTGRNGTASSRLDHPLTST